MYVGALSLCVHSLSLSLWWEAGHRQQTTRYLLKRRAEVLAMATPPALSPPMAYLATPGSTLERARCAVQTGADWLRPATQLAALVQAAGWQLHTLQDMTQLVEVYQTSMAHCRALVARLFSDAVERLRIDAPELYPVLRRLADLFALHALEQPATLTPLLETGYLQAAQVALLREQVRLLLAELRPDAVGLVDAWRIPDTALAGSALGRHDGRVYETLLALVRALGE
jgi:acyl-CoA oxidase